MTDHHNKNGARTPVLNRRGLLRIGGAAVACLAVSGHTPYRQWDVYRMRHLLVLTTREDPRSTALGQAVADVLAAHLPESRARMTRAPTLERVASLLSTDQLDVAVVPRADAVAMFAGREPFKKFGGVPLRTLAVLGAHLLISRADFHDDHAYRVVKTLATHGAALPSAPRAPGSETAVPVHGGAAAYYSGAPIPQTSERTK